MRIDLSREQYLTLVKLLQLGNWPLGLTEANQELVSKAEDLEQYIFSLSRDFEAGEGIYYDEEEEYYYLSEDLRDTVEVIIDEYEENVFWDQLTHKLATIELKREVTIEASIEQKINRLFQLKARYEKYFLENGLDKIDIL
ncbi:hypothetical protein G3A_04750 [Bacillus sp. 17376]|uniref:Uncharacterized protein n=1 Tax=Mesobacillus boroniphilus JCM 21738 TaxID=1294265 RepID=W4RLF2_9BACI|nr:hypothetical protein [Mesobacillus boroniphilus]ESU33786.1 hypothetical protein G3A_04750 [Bacillus sp. 17376]GAE44718.1 hypothetical protein JCM21738_1451 [Mesobacillus boroniphilus JCM 21738]